MWWNFWRGKRLLCYLFTLIWTSNNRYLTTCSLSTNKEWCQHQARSPAYYVRTHSLTYSTSELRTLPKTRLWIALSKFNQPLCHQYSLDLLKPIENKGRILLAIQAFAGLEKLLFLRLYCVRKEDIGFRYLTATEVIQCRNSISFVSKMVLYQFVCRHTLPTFYKLWI